MAEPTRYIRAQQSQVLKNLSSSIREGFDAWFESRPIGRRKNKKQPASKAPRLIDANMVRRSNA